MHVFKRSMRQPAKVQKKKKKRKEKSSVSRLEKTAILLNM